MEKEFKIKNYCETKILTSDNIILDFLKNLKVKEDDTFLTADNLYEFCEKHCDMCIESSEDYHYVTELENIINFDKMFHITSERINMKIKNMKSNKRGSVEDVYMASITVMNPQIDDDDITPGVMKHFIINFSELQFLRIYKEIEGFIKEKEIPVFFTNGDEVRKIYRIKMDDFRKIYFNKNYLNKYQRVLLKLIRIIEKFIVLLKTK